jgi:hypothetical protein
MFVSCSSGGLASCLVGGGLVRHDSRVIYRSYIFPGEENALRLLIAMLVCAWWVCHMLSQHTYGCLSHAMLQAVDTWAEPCSPDAWGS